MVKTYFLVFFLSFPLLLIFFPSDLNFLSQGPSLSSFNFFSFTSKGKDRGKRGWELKKRKKKKKGHDSKQKREGKEKVEKKREGVGWVEW